MSKEDWKSLGENTWYLHLPHTSICVCYIKHKDQWYAGTSFSKNDSKLRAKTFDDAIVEAYHLGRNQTI